MVSELPAALYIPTPTSQFPQDNRKVDSNYNNGKPRTKLFIQMYQCHF